MAERPLQRAFVRPGLVVVVACMLLVGGCSHKKGAPVLDLAKKGVGTCLMAAADIGPEVTNIPTVDCAKPHTHEIFAVVTYKEADVFPGLDKLDAYAQRVCIAAFEPYVGVSVFDSDLTFSWLVPTLASWTNNKDRQVLCVAGRFDGNTMTGSVKGTGTTGDTVADTTGDTTAGTTAGTTGATQP